jgi:Xaa-Pro aminopeptidase
MAGQTGKRMSNAESAIRQVSGESLTPFGEPEYRERLLRVRKEMQRREIDTLIVSDPANLFYLSGYQCSWYQDGRPSSWWPSSCIAVNVDADDLVYFEDVDELILNRMTSVAKDVRPMYLALQHWRAPDAEAGPGESHGAGPGPVAGEVFPGRVVARELRSRGWLRGPVAQEFWRYRPSRGYSELLQHELESAGAARIVDGSDVVDAVRRIKSPQELAYVRTAARLAEIGMRAAQGAMRPGVTELEVWAEADYAMARAGGEHSAIQKMIGSGPKSHCLHGLASRRRIMPGDIVNLDLCGVYNRYHSNMARSYSMGEPSRAVRELVDGTNRVFQATSEAMRPGVRVLEFLDAGRAVAEAEGIWEDNWWFGGYELGIAFPPCWVGNFVYDHRSAGADDRLEPGFVGNHEFNFYMPEGAGIRELIDSFEVTDAEVRWLHDVEKDLIVID